MSKAKHRAYRKILFKERKRVRVNGVVVIDATIVLWCIPTTETARTVKTDHVAVSYYINRKHWGIDARMPRKPYSISKTNPLASKALADGTYERMVTDAFNDAVKDYLYSLKNLPGEVIFFDQSRGEGMVKVPSLDVVLTVYACNLKGAKTGYPETACVYLEDGQQVTIAEIAEVGSGPTAIVNEGVKFDAEKWESLDQDQLMFKKDEDGNFINGMFAPGAGLR